jgi:hypothetical protein
MLKIQGLIAVAKENLSLFSLHASSKPVLLGGFVDMIRVNTTKEPPGTAEGMSSGGFLFPVADKGFAMTLAADLLSPLQPAHSVCEVG